MTAFELIRIAWPILLAVIASVAAFMVIRVTVSFLKNGVKENRGNIKVNEEYINRNSADIKVVNSDIAHIRTILDDGKAAREKAQEEHAKRLGSIEDALRSMATKDEIKATISEQVEVVLARVGK